ncbi:MULTISPECIES: peptidoglycan-binding domain-containing protein [Methanobacterium]|jgi:peptidoglycan hydrolase-like protein with peptidoglycan-binding domain|uniref:Peptidoglycan-binding domain-containing protein n=2 Tax=Methanobacterium veterum TaxID=408577 RepID=A0A9E4ZYN6_9EURY|nr:MULTISPECIES: peptidoglycan-binding domain-containing protein [Methanobacterium]MCZ3371362.1 peptidoglycan-binding domain-containing protein [Methanobacterium veterum]
MVAVCVMFSTLPFAAATEIQNTTFNVTQSSSVNAVTEKGLKIGANGTYVVELQKWLKEQGYYTGDVDGSFGPYTELAVKYFQNDSSIIVDGWVANQTTCAMEDINGVNIFEEAFGTSTSSSNVKSTDKTNVTKSSTTTTKSSVNKTSSTTTSVTKKETTSTTKKQSTSTAKKTSTTSSASLSAILASGAKYGYSHSASTAAGMVAIGSGDCWAMSEYLYGKLSAAGIHSRIVQYSTAYSARHRSVQLYQNGAWVDVPYSSYGYSTMFKATSSKPGMTVLASC